MDNFYPHLEDIRLAKARQTGKRRGKFNIEVNGHTVPLLELFKNGFSIASNRDLQLRGYVTIYEGANAIAEALIIRGEALGEKVYYEFKTRSEYRAAPPADYVEETEKPKALLGYFRPA